MKKILYMDLDATLLSDDKTVSEGNRNAILRMLAEGHYVAFATGRTLESAKKVARELALIMPGCYMVVYNGAVVYDSENDKVLARRSLPLGVVEEIFARAEAAGIFVQTYQAADVIAKKYTRELQTYVTRNRLNYQLAENILEALEDEPEKVLLIDLDDREHLVKFQKENLAWEQGKCESFFSCKEYLEYCPIGTNKGMGVGLLTKILGLPPEAVIAVGDEENDISMIEKAHIGVAMKNAIPALKAVADYVTERDNNHDGVAEVIEKFVL